MSSTEQLNHQSVFRRTISNMFHSAYLLNLRNIINLLDRDENAFLLDVGCNDGVWTCELAKKINTSHLFGIEIVEDRAQLAQSKGIEVKVHDASLDFPYSSESFDVIHANQVIEHVPDIDKFISEIHRVLKTNGYAIISTENASSWHNIFAIVLGWQMFSLTNLSRRSLGVGNPLSIHRKEKGHLSSWTHKVIFSYRGLTEFLENYGFRVEAIKGAGYYPFPSQFGLIDTRHAHFLAIKITKI